MDPLKVVIVKPGDSGDTAGGVCLMGAIAWIVLTWMYWSGAGWFDNIVGRICFVPALVVAAIIGYHTTLFILGASFLITIFGLLVGWIFDFPFFEATFKYIGIAYRYLFN